VTYQDKTIACRDCDGQFVFTAGEQEFYAQKGFTNEPVRCPLRRRARKQGHEGISRMQGQSCPQDVTGAGIIRAEDLLHLGEHPRSDERLRSDRKAQRDRAIYGGSLPAGTVQATVLRVAPDGRYLFAHVEEPDIDVYVHHELFDRLKNPPRAGDQIRVTLERSDRGVRARTLEAV
jgi:hypothetical protein